MRNIEKMPVKKFVESDVVNMADVQMNVVANKSFSALDMFMQADIFVQLIMLLLVAMSIYSWAIAIDKIFLLKSVNREYLLFNKLLQDNHYDVRAIEQKHFSLIKKMNIFGDIIFIIYNRLYVASPNSLHANDSLQSAKNELLQDVELKIQEINEQMESKLYLLGTISSSAPFIGLLGTVWGIMNSFQSIVFMKNASIAAVAPGIAEALLATALGLVVAIPALIFNNKFYSSLESLDAKLNVVFNRLLTRLKV
ncbi:MotA/TolQ/ExbB proton channel family protein [Candidatus Bandiella euplotis]|uniref:Tol-Pal system subunit TolQ n=1 Tax=Candidatus Bandiella euplotis TaxID=1664265 RepID=A0ABZ0UM19_9RICK|nr:MotA/TolQ/ExbB proton channel family protein [Candidatus Bandiella woodruffii]WPX97195.1 Tol-Pal system subunit TolQ [Candidatus Bandiella woodruffii]